MEKEYTKNVAIDNQDARSILENQIGMLQHLQDQAQRTIRILIAAAALTVAFLSRNQNLLQEFSIPKSPEPFAQTANQLGIPAYLVYEITIVNILISILLLMLSVLFIGQSFVHFVSILSPELLLPLSLETKNESLESVQDLTRGNSPSPSINDKISWISRNELRLSKLSKKIDSGYMLIGGATGSLLTTIILLWLISDIEVGSLVYINIFIFVMFTAGFLGFLFRIGVPIGIRTCYQVYQVLSIEVGPSSEIWRKFGTELSEVNKDLSEKTAINILSAEYRLVKSKYKSTKEDLYLPPYLLMYFFGIVILTVILSLLSIVRWLSASGIPF